MDVKVGDKVLYAKYAGTEFKIDGDDLLIVSQKDILAIVAGLTAVAPRPPDPAGSWRDIRIG